MCACVHAYVYADIFVHLAKDPYFPNVNRLPWDGRNGPKVVHFRPINLNSVVLFPWWAPVPKVIGALQQLLILYWVGPWDIEYFP